MSNEIEEQKDNNDLISNMIEAAKEKIKKIEIYDNKIGDPLRIVLDKITYISDSHIKRKMDYLSNFLDKINQIYEKLKHKLPIVPYISLK